MEDSVPEKSLCVNEETDIRMLSSVPASICFVDKSRWCCFGLSSEAVAELSTDQRPSATGGQVSSDR